MAKKPDQKRVYSRKGGAGIIPGNPGNSGGKKGRSGRPTLAFKEFCKDVLDAEETQKAIRTAAKNARSKGFAPVLKMLAGYAEGLPVQPVKHSGEISHVLADRMTRARERNRSSR